MDGGMLLGIFHVNLAHNIVHLASGAVFLLCGLAGAGPSRTFFKIFGLVYALVAILGFMKGDGMLLGCVANNMADVWLHVGLAVVMLFFGFVAKDSARIILRSFSARLHARLNRLASGATLSPWSD